jgi:hypothetical protein
LRGGKAACVGFKPLDSEEFFSNRLQTIPGSGWIAMEGMTEER